MELTYVHSGAEEVSVDLPGLFRGTLPGRGVSLMLQECYRETQQPVTWRVRFSQVSHTLTLACTACAIQ
jgi:hypothetical protein